MKHYVAIVEDEPDISDLIKINLEKAGLEVTAFPDGKKFFNQITKKKPDLILLDLMLPDIDGLEICKRLQQQTDTKKIPIIMLTARDDEVDKVLGLELGADDYITKPFSPKELTARVRAVLRRVTDSETSNIIDVGNILSIDENRHEIKLRGTKIPLTTAEFKIVQLLSSKPGWVFSREQILDHIWGYEKAVVDRTIDVHIRHLREKFNEDSEIIQSIRGIGYKLEI